jgi:TRAP-type C4-dicarboxylate transport system permease small subunit
MSANTHVLEDNSRLSRMDRLLYRLESWLTLAGGLTIFALVFFSTTNVLGRWLFSLPINGYIDWIEQAMAFMAFLGLAYTQRQGGHIRMDIAIAHIHGRALWITEFLSTLLMLLVTLVLVYGSYLHFWRAYDIGDSSLDINLPTWPAKLVVPIALTLLALRLLVQLWAYARAIRLDDERPVAVPLIEDAATNAAQEAKSLLGNGVDGSDNGNREEPA